MLEFWRRMLMCARESLKPTRLKGRGRVEWLSTFKCQLPSVIVHGEGKQDKLKGKNLLDPKDMGNYPNRGFEVNTTSDGTTYIDGISDGSGQSDYGTYIGLFENWLILDVSKQTTFTLSISKKLDFDILVSGIGNISVIIFAGRTSATFTLPPDLYKEVYIGVGIHEARAEVHESFKLQLEEGSTPTPYEPYCGGIPAPNPQYPIEPVFLEGASVTDETNTAPLPILRALPDGSVKDEIDVVSGTVVRRIGVKEFDGSEVWDIAYPFRAVCLTIVPKVKSNANVFISSHGGHIQMASAQRNTFQFGNRTNPFNEYWGFDNAQDWTNYLKAQKAAGTPITIGYALETPIIEHYDPAILRQHPGYTQLIQQGGFREAEIEADVFPVEE